ncbi:MAG: sialate O-acetylesterase [Planctomycetaceae bacterium]
MLCLLGCVCGLVLWLSGAALLADEDSVVRVFIFAGQSNMVGSDSKIADIARFPPFAGLDQPQPAVRFSYCLGREEKLESAGWEPLRPVYNVVGPELSFAREVTSRISAPIAVIKVAAGGTHLGGDWNPDQPTGFQLYPLALRRVREALGRLDSEGVKWRLEGFMWHQGENDMFEAEYMASYGKNLKNFIASWRRDLRAPELRFFIGELCTKTIWGMDLRPRMYAISLGQKEVADADPLVEYVPTSHVGTEIGGGAGLHYHYGTLGQLEHGVCYARSWLQATGQWKRESRGLGAWPYAAGSKVRLIVLAGHRNMEGERAFVQDLAKLPGGAALLQPDLRTAGRYSQGGGYSVSDGWEPMGPWGEYETFGPELSFAATMRRGGAENIAIAKFTHSGSQIIDWTPEGSEAKGRNLYPSFLEFVRQSVQDLRDRGHEVELSGICYHVGENDMSWGPFRQGAPERVLSLVQALRKDLQQPQLRWYISQQLPSDHESVRSVDVMSRMSEVLAGESGVVLLQALDLPPQREQLVLDAAGVVRLGELLASSVLSDLRVGRQR